MLGDFWQLPPAGQLAIMSNPYSNSVLQCAQANSIMAMFWLGGHREALQTWEHQERVLHLTVNKRSGKDAWFSELLDVCREGKLDCETDFNFLHGFPTMVRARLNCTDPRCDNFETEMTNRIKDTTKSWTQHWHLVPSVRIQSAQCASLFVTLHVPCEHSLRSVTQMWRSTRLKIQRG